MDEIPQQVLTGADIAIVAKYLGKPLQCLKELANTRWMSARAGIDLKVDFVNSFDCPG